MFEPRVHCVHFAIHDPAKPAGGLLEPVEVYCCHCGETHDTKEPNGRVHGSYLRQKEPWADNAYPFTANCVGPEKGVM